ncbi:S46 family peptidase [Solimicrobium silvestre]|uniref:Dipeptidyl-peptidase n=1 Tax=Solimicrobium silvestre TaxID=2099400 RepID=A0A2S9GXJ7_9BURK|nr:S46 family peptidase [Solimicrobium silvestre]PRC92431.1 Peptidase S46 [Solimicrobium silvestre]
MKKSLLLLGALSTLSTFGSIAFADEGMWMPQQLPQIAKQLKADGLQLDPNTLTKLTEFPMGAIVSLGGCSASFVSPQGLVITNHHCAYSSVSHNSSPEHNYLANGFLAKTLSDELPASPGFRVFVTTDVNNVSSKVISSSVAKLNGKKRVDAIEKNQKDLVAACEKEAGTRCNVASYYGGLEFYLIKQLEIRDVRLVHAPAEGVGKFGGDTDNWMWPRHTGDYSFFRAYVNKDGKPADFSKDNVPYVPKHYLRLASQALKEGDFVMVTGYPGRTNRHRLPSEIEQTFNWSYPAFVKASGEQLAIIAQATSGNEDLKLKYASAVASVNNYYKNRQGMLDSYAGSDILPRKEKQLADLKTWVNADPKRKQEYAHDIDQVEQLMAERDAQAKKDFLISYSTPRLLTVAKGMLRFSHESEKADIDRKIGYQEHDMARFRASTEGLDRSYDANVDQALALHFLTQYIAQPKDQRNANFDAALNLHDGMTETDLKTMLTNLYASSKLGTKEARVTWLDKKPADFNSSDDGFIKAAVALYDENMKREDRDNELAGKIQQTYANYMKAKIAYMNSIGQAIYPDANSTLRVTFGKVAGREQGADGTSWTAFTSLRGILAKNTGSGEFNAPTAQLTAIKEANQEALKTGNFGKYGDAKLNSVPVNFLATLDITGGNSGSAALNAKGELVGLAFDGTLDSIISDWDYNKTKSRSIQVDLRYILWEMTNVDHADNLLKELKVK